MAYRPSRGSREEAPMSILRILGNNRKLCDGISRRDLIQAGALSLFVRTMTHEYPIHSVAFSLTGTGRTDLAMETNDQDPRHWPYFGSVVDYVDSKAPPASTRRRRASDLPQNVILPHRFGRPGTNPHW